jgi:hypothetical protein
MYALKQSKLASKRDWPTVQGGMLYKYRDNLHIVRDVVENPLSSTAVRKAVQEVRHCSEDKTLTRCLCSNIN